MYAIFLQCTHCVKKTLIVSCTLLCDSGDRVMVDQSSFSADLHAVMLRHHCWEYDMKYLHRFAVQMSVVNIEGNGHCIIGNTHIS